MLLKVEKFYRCSVVLRATSLLALGYLVLTSLNKGIIIIINYYYCLFGGSPYMLIEAKHHRNFATLQSYNYLCYFFLNK